MIVFAYILLSADYLLTRYAIVKGIATEANPILTYVMSSTPLTILVLLLIGGLMYWTHTVRHKVDERIYLLYWLVIISRVWVITVHLRGWWN